MPPTICFFKKKQSQYFHCFFLSCYRFPESSWWSETHTMSQATYYWSRMASQFFVCILISLNFCLPFHLCCHTAQMASLAFPAVTLSSFPCVSAFLLSFPPFRVFLQERSESLSPILYLGKLRSREGKLLNTRAGELGPPLDFYPLWQEHLHKCISTECIW